MAQQHKIQGYDDLIECVNRLKKDDKPINIYFTGSKDDTGKSWCPDCVEGNELTSLAINLVNVAYWLIIEIVSVQLNHLSTRLLQLLIQIRILSTVMSVIGHCKSCIVMYSIIHLLVDEYH